MPNKDLDTLFQEAVAAADKMTQSDLPQDVQLRLYAHYKQATYGTIDTRISTPSFDLRNAFKTNAWMQISHLSVDQAKEEYINIINSLIKK
jgi:acyl-CoA-binding protein